MSLHEDSDHDPRIGQRTGLMVLAGILLVIPIVALLWVAATRA